MLKSTATRNKPEKLSIQDVDPNLASQLKLDAVVAVRQRRGLTASLRRVEENIAQIEEAFGDVPIEDLLNRWGMEA
jgi:hypothetical protein